LTATLSSRARAVLYAAVSEFIATGEPVGSRTIAKKYGFSLSAATIRNVLSDLEELGYLVQPHTSAGRVPTETAFRLFIDDLMKTQQLSFAAAARIASWLDEVPLSKDVLRSTGKLLSELTGVPAIVVRTQSSERVVLKIRFVPTRPQEILSVVVFVDGSVENRFIHVDEPVEERDLERLHELLEHVAVSRSLAEIREHFARACEDERLSIEQLGYTKRHLVEQALASRAVVSELVVEGQSKLFERPEFATSDELKSLLYALDDHERLVTLLDRTLSVSDVQVYLGGEIFEREHRPMSLIAAPFRVADGEALGAVGVLGPRRMDYPVVVPLVGATADAVGAVLSRGDVRSNIGTAVESHVDEAFEKREPRAANTDGPS
jgi:heat-inducible transcriptional repressor